MTRIIFTIIISLISTYLAAQPEIRKLSLYDMKGDVACFTEKQYKAEMSFGELTKGELVESRYCEFDSKGNLTYCEVEESGEKKKTYQYEYNDKGQLYKVKYPSGSIATFYYNNGRLNKIDTHNSNGTLEARTKRSYNSSTQFTDIEYNSDGKEKMRSIYRNNLLSSEKSDTESKEYIYNAQRKLIETRHSWEKVDMGKVATALMFANVTGNADMITNMKGEKVSSTTRNNYNSRGFINKTVTNGTDGKNEVISTQYEYDSKGNWIKAVSKYKGNSMEVYLISERVIEYFTDTQKTLSKSKGLERYKTSLPDRKAEYPGGIDKYIEYVQTNQIYPIMAQEKKISGDVKIAFIIDREGKATDFKVIKSVDHYLDREGIRLLKNMPKWKPAIKDGQFVSEKDTATFTFRLD